MRALLIYKDDRIVFCDVPQDQGPFYQQISREAEPVEAFPIGDDLSVYKCSRRVHTFKLVTTLARANGRVLMPVYEQVDVISPESPKAPPRPVAGRIEWECGCVTRGSGPAHTWDSSQCHGGTRYGAGPHRCLTSPLDHEAFRSGRCTICEDRGCHACW